MPRNSAPRPPGRRGPDRRPARGSRPLIGVLAVESTDPLAFMPREDTILTIVAAQLATGIEQLSRDTEEVHPRRRLTTRASRASTRARTARQTLLLLSQGRLRLRRRRLSDS